MSGVVWFVPSSEWIMGIPTSVRSAPPSSVTGHNSFPSSSQQIKCRRSRQTSGPSITTGTSAGSGRLEPPRRTLSAAASMCPWRRLVDGRVGEELGVPR